MPLVDSALTVGWVRSIGLTPDTAKYFYYEGHFRADAAPEVYDDEALRWLWHQSARALVGDHAPAA